MLNKAVSSRNSRVSLSKVCALAASAVVFSLLNPVHAASYTWDGGDASSANGANGGTGTWDTSTTNWFDGASDIAWTDTTGTADAAVFGPSAGTVTIGTPVGATGLTFSVGGYTVTGSGLTLGTGGISQAINSGTTTISSGVTLAGNQSWTTGAGTTIIASGTISGSTNLTKAGGGTLTLSGANTGYSGVTTVSLGRLNINDANALGSGNLVLAGQASPLSYVATNIEPNLYLDNTSGAAITLATNNTMSWNNGSGNGFTFIGTNSLNMGTGAVTMANNKIVSVLNNTLTIGGAIADGGGASIYGLTKNGAGTLALTNSANTYQGTTVLMAGKLSLGASGQLYTGATVGALQVVGGELELLGNSAAPHAQTFASYAVGTGGSNLDGRSIITAIADPAQPTTITFTGATPTRIKGSHELFRGTSMNSAAGAGVGSIVFGTGAGPTVTLGTTDGNFYSAIVGGTTGTTQAAVFRGALADDSATGNGTGFATYDTTLNKVRVLNAATEQTTSLTADTNVFRTATATSFAGLRVNTMEINNISGSNVVQPLSGTLNPVNGLLFSGNSSISLSGGTISSTGSDTILMSTNTSSSGVTISSAINNATGPGQHSVTFGGPGNFNINATLTASSSGGFFFNGPGTVTLNASQSPTSQGFTVGGGTLKLGSSFTQASSRPFKVAQGATFDLNGVSVTNADFISDLNAGGGTITNNGSAASTLTLTNGSSTGNVIYPFSGTITNGANPLNIVINSLTSATATYFLTGANTYTGATTVTQGNLRVGANNTLPTSTALTVTGNNAAIPAVVDLGGYNQQVGSLAGTATASSAFIQNSVASTASTLTIGGSTSTQFDGLIRDNAGTGGTVALAKSGTGNLTLTATNTYSGGTAITGGGLIVNGAIGAGATTVNGGTLMGGGTAAGSVTVNSTGHIAPGTSGSGTGGNIGTFTTTGLSFTNGSIYDVDLNATNADKITSNNGLSLSGTVGLNLFTVGTNSPFSTSGTYTLFSVPTGTIPSLPAITSAFNILNPASGASYSWGISGTDVQLTIVGSVAAQWANTIGGDWGTGANWTSNPTTPSAAGDTAIFGTNLLASDQVLLNGNKTVGNVTFNNASASYDIAQGSSGTLTIDNGSTVASITNSAGNHTISAPLSLTSNANISVTNSTDTLTISGDISGAGNLGVLGGAGTTVLTGTNSYGTTTVASGNTLQIGNGGTSGTVGSGALTVNGTLAINRSDAVTISQGISGSGTVASTGSGTTTITGTNSGTWGMNVASGGTVNIGTGGATVSGTGAVTLNGTLNYNSSSNNSVGVITGSGALNQQGTGTLLLASASPSFSGPVTVTGGTLKFGASGSAGTGAISVNNATINENNVSTTQTNNIDFQGTDTIDTFGSTTMTLNGNITGNGTINRSGGTGTLSLGGATVIGPVTGNAGFNGVFNNTSGNVTFTNKAAGSTAAQWNFTSGTVTLSNMGGTISFGALNGTTSTITTSGNTARIRIGDVTTVASSFPGNITGGSNGVAILKTGSNSLTLSGQNSGFTADAVTNFTGFPVVVAGGSVIAGSSTTGATSGPLGGSGAKVIVGNGAAPANTASLVDATLLTSGAVTVSNPLYVSPGSNVVTSTPYTLTIGGGTDNNSTFSGAISLMNNVTISQVATTGANHLTLSGAISGTALNTGPLGGTTPQDGPNNTGVQTVTFAGPGAITASGVISNGTGTVNVASSGGTTTLSALNTYTGTTSSTGGKLITNNGVQNGNSMSMSGGGVIEVPLNGSTSGVTSVSSMTTTGAGSHLELHDNDLVINYGANPTVYTDTVNQVKSGLVLLGGTGTEGISSAEADAQTIQGTILAVVDDGDVNIAGAITSTSGFTIPAPASSVIVKFTWFGDSNLDGIVDGSDYALLDSGFTSGGSLGGWVFGDYDYSGVVDGSDYALIDTGFISQNAVLPEPTTLGLLGLGAMGMLRRRRQA